MILEKPSDGAEMSDAAYAQDLVFKLAAPVEIGDSIKGQIDRAYKRLLKGLEKAGRDDKEIRKKWKWRRVKAFWYLEVPDYAVRTQETRDLELVVGLREARKAHAEFNAETERLAAIHFPQDEDFYRDQIEARRLFARGVDLSRIAGGEK